MSIQTWKAEYLPISAVECVEQYPLTHHKAGLNAAQHSLKKWEGTRKEELDRHGIIKIGAKLSETDSIGDVGMFLGGDTCALCELAEQRSVAAEGTKDEKDDDYDGKTMCLYCPLYEVRENNACTSFSRDVDKDDSPWDASVAFKPDVEPMIEWLKKTVEQELNK